MGACEPFSFVCFVTAGVPFAQPSAHGRAPQNGINRIHRSEDVRCHGYSFKKNDSVFLSVVERGEKAGETTEAWKEKNPEP